MQSCHDKLPVYESLLVTGHTLNAAKTHAPESEHLKLLSRMSIFYIHALRNKRIAALRAFDYRRNTAATPSVQMLGFTVPSRFASETNRSDHSVR